MGDVGTHDLYLGDIQDVSRGGEWVREIPMFAHKEESQRQMLAALVIDRTRHFTNPGDFADYS